MTALLALDARMVALTPAGETVYEAAAFGTGLFETCLAGEALLVRIEVPPQPVGARTGYSRFLLREGEYPMTQVCVRLGSTVTSCARRASPWAGPGTGRCDCAEVEAWLSGAPVAGLPEAVKERVRHTVEPYPDVRGSADWKAQVVAAMARRAIAQATRDYGLTTFRGLLISEVSVDPRGSVAVAVTAFPGSDPGGGMDVQAALPSALVETVRCRCRSCPCSSHLGSRRTRVGRTLTVRCAACP